MFLIYFARKSEHSTAFRDAAHHWQLPAGLNELLYKIKFIFYHFSGAFILFFYFFIPHVLYFYIRTTASHTDPMPLLTLTL